MGSAKKLRKKAQKEMKNKLYSNFVKSGTLTGGKMEEEDAHEDFVEEKDLSKLRELTDEELVAACGGRTAHKGSRHGHNMTAKLDRIAEAEREYMEKYNKKIEEAQEKTTEKFDQSEESFSSKKKRKHSLEDEVEESAR